MYDHGDVRRPWRKNLGPGSVVCCQSCSEPGLPSGCMLEPVTTPKEFLDFFALD